MRLVDDEAVLVARAAALGEQALDLSRLGLHRAAWGSGALADVLDNGIAEVGGGQARLVDALRLDDDNRLAGLFDALDQVALEGGFARAGFADDGDKARLFGGKEHVLPDVALFVGKIDVVAGLDVIDEGGFGQAEDLARLLG